MTEKRPENDSKMNTQQNRSRQKLDIYLFFFSLIFAFSSFLSLAESGRREKKEKKRENLTISSWFFPEREEKTEIKTQPVPNSICHFVSVDFVPTLFSSYPTLKPPLPLLPPPTPSTEFHFKLMASKLQFETIWNIFSWWWYQGTVCLNQLIQPPPSPPP